MSCDIVLTQQLLSATEFPNNIGLLIARSEWGRVICLIIENTVEPLLKDTLK